MDRQTVYSGQILPETTLLQMAKDSMISVAKLSSALFGTSTMANGFAVTPTGPASLQVVVAPGEIYSLTSVDATDYSSLAADTTHSIMKQGILLDAVTLTCAAPTTTGQSINYLVQATYQDVDSNPVLLPYYNSANPSLPFSGMGNNGLTQNTSRKGAAVVAVKAGVSAPTGSQTTPAPDAGYVGLYVVTVAFGQTAITSISISQYISAPLLPGGLLQSVQNGNTSFALDTGTANAYAFSLAPVLSARSEGVPIRVKVKTNNTGASTVNDGLGIVPLVGGAHSPLQGGEMRAGGDAWIQWNSTVGTGSYILLFCTGAPDQVAPAAQSQHALPLGQANSLYGGNTTLVSATGVTTLTSANAGLVIIDATAGNIAIGLPVASTTGSTFQFVRTDLTANTVTIARSSTDLIGGAQSITLNNQYSTAALRSNGSNAWNFFTGATRFTTRFTANGSWTCPAGVVLVWATGTAGGGGGAGGNPGTGAGAGGGAGQSDIKYPISVVPGTTYTVTIGAGGAGGAINTGGGAGGITSLGSVLSWSGGGGGSTAGPGGLNGGGVFSQSGQSVSSTIPTVGGQGGSSAFGGGGQGGLGGNTGVPAAPNSGAGGGGGGGGGSGNVGANGGSGFLILEG